MQGKLQDKRDATTILFGAFDRHNFGDLLFPHVAAALLPKRRLCFAGLEARDLRACGGHQVSALASLAQQLRGEVINILHAGGELLTCTHREAAVMLLEPLTANAVLRQQQGTGPGGQHSEEIGESVLQIPGIPDHVPYLASRQLFPDAHMLCNALGGVDLDRLAPVAREEALQKLRGADWLGVRDRVTQAVLQAHGVRARLLPDSAVMVVELFGEKIAARAGHRGGEVADIAMAFPKGYLAMQFSTDFGDDRTLNQLAVQLDAVARTHDLGIVLFRAGAAPWHDDLNDYRRLVGRLQSARTHLFESLDLWDICALISSSRAYCGSSLHGRIVAMAHALPRLNISHNARHNAAHPEGGAISKQSAYAATWDPGIPGLVAVEELKEALDEALSVPAHRLQQRAQQLAADYRTGFAALTTALA